LRAADVKVEPVCGNPRTFRITVMAYLNTQSNTRFGTNSQVFFGDGGQVRIPLTIATVRPDLGVNIAVATFVTTHTYATDGIYTVAYQERDRSSGILNIANSDDVPYTTFVTHVVNSKYSCNNYPVLTVPPLDRACFAVAFFHTPGAYDIDGDSLSYELTVPKSDVSTFANYTSPASSSFYTNFNIGNEAKTGPPTFGIDPVTGLLTWDSPGAQGEYNIAFNIIEWRKDSLSGTYTRLSTTTRDMQILVEACDNIRPTLTVPVSVCVEAGTVIDESIFGTDGDNHRVKIEVFSEITDLEPDQLPASYSPNPPEFVSSVPAAEVKFHWQTDCIHVRTQPYQVVFKITDDPPLGPKLVNFQVWNITVVAPAPVWQETQLDLVKRSAVLQWQPYACANADKMQVWRKVDSYSYVPGLCEMGIPKFLGYTLVGEVPIGQTSFIDTNQGKGLVVGAKYCYRLVAYFNAPNNVASKVSAELCVGPIEADAPVITHVSVEKTDPEVGIHRISWRSPFNINTTQFPQPYEYEVYQADSFFGEAGIRKVGRTNDTTFENRGLNTLEKVFNYRVVLYAKPQNAVAFVPVDTSAVASSVHLVLTPGEQKFDLAWSDSVPWSNVVQSKPYHLIYRGKENDHPNQMILIDSVNVTENGFVYTDVGRFANEGIQDDQRYSYRVVTRGTYGNPQIQLQENASQVLTSYPESDLLPCTQVLTLNRIECDDYLATQNCGQTFFTNRFSWQVTTRGGCRKNIVSYNVYAADTPESEFVKIASNITDTIFQDVGLPSFARCYRVSAVDVKGMESELSEASCNDNCPFYLLPNVFTPNGDGLNDTFSANFDRLLGGETIPTGPVRCPRFVRSVSVKICNRWGQEVFHFASENPETIVIDWNGKDMGGQELSNGVYYYTADIQFDVLDPLKQSQVIRGWVHLLR
jgi:hypothetical protein